MTDPLHRLGLAESDVTPDEYRTAGSFEDIAGEATCGLTRCGQAFVMFCCGVVTVMIAKAVLRLLIS